MPITWKNVGTPGFGDSAEFMKLGSASLNKGLNALGGQAQGLADDQNTVAKENYLAKINSATDLESLSSLGTDIDSLRKNTGTGFDVGAVQQAAQAKKNQLAPDLLYRDALSDFSKGMDPLELEAKLRSQAKKLNLSPAVAEQARTAALADYTRLSQYRTADQQDQEAVVAGETAATLAEINNNYAKEVEAITQDPDYQYFDQSLKNQKELSLTELMGEATESEMWGWGSGDKKSGDDLQIAMRDFIKENPTVPLSIIRDVFKNATRTEDAIEIFGSGKRVAVDSFKDGLATIGERFQKYDSGRKSVGERARTTEAARAVLSSQAAKRMTDLARKFAPENIKKALQ